MSRIAFNSCSKYFQTTLILVLIILINLHKGDASCTLDEWKCDDGQCISIDNLCDGTIECKDGSDETAENCIHTSCSVGFRCAYGACIAGKQMCNGEKNCADNSDELPRLCDKSLFQELATERQGNCEAAEFQCQLGECTSNDNVCDGFKHCANGADEVVEICGNLQCASYAFTCGYGACIAKKGKCDLNIDCADGSDEASILCGRPRKVVTTTISTPIFTTPSSTSDRVGGDGKCEIPYSGSDLIYTNIFTGTKIQIGEKVPNNVIIDIKCEPGNYLQGSTRNICTNSNWRNSFPVCTKYCDPIVNGDSTNIDCTYNSKTVDCNNHIRSGTLVKIYCAKEFQQPTFFHETLRCKENFQWNFMRIPCEMSCGKIQDQVTKFIKGGTQVDIVEVPWHVGVYSTFAVDSYTYICGGTIISPRLVISAAHCFWDAATQKITSAEYFKVAAGKVSKVYNNPAEENAQKSNILSIEVRDYTDVDGNYKHDLALLILQKHFEFTHSVRPICFKFLSGELKHVSSNQNGIFAGWGPDPKAKNPREAVEVLQRIQMRTLSHYECNRNSSSELSPDKFCIINSYDATGCRGDSGGGFVVEDRHIDSISYRLVGVISFARERVQDCAKDGVIALTNVQHFEWLREYIRKHELKL